MNALFCLKQGSVCTERVFAQARQISQFDAQWNNAAPDAELRRRMRAELTGWSQEVVRCFLGAVPYHFRVCGLCAGLGHCYSPSQN